MQDKTYKGTTKSIDAYDDQISLWNLVGGNGLKLLQQISDTECLFEKRDRPLSIILSGNSTTLYSICFLRALAMQISQIPTQMLSHQDGLVEFFTPTHADRGYIVEDIEYLDMGIQAKIVQIIQNGRFTQYDLPKKSINTYPVFGAILLTCKDIKRVIPQLTKSVDYVIHIEDLTQGQIRQVIKMRLQYAHVEYENEKVIDKLAVGNSLRTIISVVKLAIVVMLFENRSTLTVKDVLKAREYF
jgi:hypothetical protein